MLKKLRAKLRSFIDWCQSFEDWRSFEDWWLGLTPPRPKTPPKRPTKPAPRKYHGLTWEQQVVRQFRIRLDKMNKKLESEEE